MRILVNVLAVRAGGGQQVALGLMEQVVNQGMTENFIFVTGSGTFLSEFGKRAGLTCRDMSYSYIKRALCVKGELIDTCREFGIDVIFAFTPTPRIRGIPVVLRTVYSNLYFPEVDFWRGLPLSKRIWKSIIDIGRRSGTFSADGLLFENEAMQKRAIERFGYSKERTGFVGPSVSAHIFSQQADESVGGRKEEFEILLLTSWHKNKNLEMLPDVAERLKSEGLRFRFTISLRPKDAAPLYEVLVKKRFEGLFSFIGTVPPNLVGQTVMGSSVVLLLSKLECFSSNIVEAWHFGRALVCADEPWSRAACGDGAVFVDRDSAPSIANALARLARDEGFYKRVVEAGGIEYSKMNTPEEKFRSQMAFLRKIYEMGPR